MNPKVSVLMPVYNGEKYLKTAIESILNQSYADFEFLIINDGSIDNTAGIIKSYTDPRIRLITNEKNLGLAETCNKGVELAKGEYIIRMDADDISRPKRIERQVNFMDLHKEIGVCGTWARFFGDGLRSFVNNHGVNDGQIKSELLFNTCFIHPSVIIRRSIMVENKLRYRKDLEPGDDYRLWAEASLLTEFANLPCVLLEYRLHQTNISKTQAENQKLGAKSARLFLLNKLGIEPSSNELDIHSRLMARENENVFRFLDNKEHWLVKLKEQNDKCKFFMEPNFSNELSRQWLLTCSANSRSGAPILKKALTSRLLKNNADQWKLKLKLAAKILIGR